MGDPVALDGTGHATSPPLAMRRTPLEITEGSDAWEVSAFFMPGEDSEFDMSDIADA